MLLDEFRAEMNQRLRTLRPPMKLTEASDTQRHFVIWSLILYAVRLDHCRWALSLSIGCVFLEKAQGHY